MADLLCVGCMHLDARLCQLRRATHAARLMTLSSPRAAAAAAVCAAHPPPRLAVCLDGVFEPSAVSEAVLAALREHLLDSFGSNQTTILARLGPGPHKMRAPTRPP